MGLIIEQFMASLIQRRDMSSFEILIELCITVFMIIEMQHDGELKYFKDMASYVKKRIEDEEKGTSGWHVIVGKYLKL